MSRLVPFGAEGSDTAEKVRLALAQVELIYVLLITTVKELTETKSELVRTKARIDAALIGEREVKEVLHSGSQGTSAAFSMALLEMIRTFTTQFS